MRGIFRFFRRQLKSKTGRLALSIIGGSILNGVTTKTMGVGVAEIPFAGAILDSILGPEISSVMLGFNFLRDGKAKEEHPELA